MGIPEKRLDLAHNLGYVPFSVDRLKLVFFISKSE
jgi:hypothetical protein